MDKIPYGDKYLHIFVIDFVRFLVVPNEGPNNYLHGSRNY